MLIVSKNEEFYMQEYCGCVYSLRDTNIWRHKNKREKIVKGMKKDKAGFKKRYGKDAEAVMYATATKQAMK